MRISDWSSDVLLFRSMVPHVLCTAVEYDIPVVWVVWNNFAWAAIRDLQYAYFDGREIGTAFYHGPNRKPYNPDFAAWARAAGVAAFTVTRSQDFAGVLAQAVALDKPALIDVHVDADIRPPSTGPWEQIGRGAGRVRVGQYR